MYATYDVASRPLSDHNLELVLTDQSGTQKGTYFQTSPGLFREITAHIWQSTWLTTSKALRQARGKQSMQAELNDRLYG